MKIPKTEELFDISHTLAKPLLEREEHAFHVLPLILDFIKETGRTLDKGEYERISDEVWIARSAMVASEAHIHAPAIIGHETEVRYGAFIRGAALIGDGCVIGNSTEVKNAIIFDGVEIPHYNYVGDSILGYRSHMGAGAIASNFKLDHTNINLKDGDEFLKTGLRKFGVLLGDFAQIGCNSVLFPGTIIGRRTLVYPTSKVRGIIPECHIYKDEGRIVKMENGD